MKTGVRTRVGEGAFPATSVATAAVRPRVLSREAAVQGGGGMGGAVGGWRGGGACGDEVLHE